MSPTPLSQRQELENAFISRLIDNAAIPRGGQAYINAAEELKQLCSRFHIVKSQETHGDEAFRFRVYYKPKGPCDKIDVKLDINANMKTLQQQETQAIIAIADQNETYLAKIAALEVENKKLKQTSDLWQAEAERWRDVVLKQVTYEMRRAYT